MEDSPEEKDQRPGCFQATQWSLILAAADTGGENQLSHLGELCQRYWQPIFYFVRSKGYNVHDAEDLTQEFLSQFATGKILKVADPLRGRFRSFVLKCCKNFLINAKVKASAAKRGGGNRIISIQGVTEEGGDHLFPDPNIKSPDHLFDKQWALAVLRRVLKQLGESYEKEGKGQLFDALKETLTGDRKEEGYASVAKRLDLSESNVKVFVHRMRQRYKTYIKREIASTVCTEKEVEEELKYLIAALK